MFSLVWMIGDLALFWAVIVTGIMAMFGKISPKAPLILLVLFVVTVAIIMLVEIRHAAPYDDYDESLELTEDEIEDDLHTTNQKDA